MDGRRRTVLGWSFPAGAWLAGQLAATTPCPAQQAEPPAAPVQAARADEDVRMAHFHEGQPSPQQPPQAPPKPQPQPQPTYPPTAPPYQGYPPPYQAYPQPYPAYPPQYPVYPPPYPMAPPPAAPNFFLPGAAPAAPAYPAPPAAPPAYGMAPMVPAYAPMPAPVQPTAALVGSSVAVPTTKSKTTVEVRGPGMLGAAMARVGERMVQMGRTRIRTVQETVLETPQSQPMGGGIATIATTGLVPVAPPAAPQQPPVQPPPEAPPTPSPQGGSAREKSAIHRLFGHE